MNFLKDTWEHFLVRLGFLCFCFQSSESKSPKQVKGEWRKYIANCSSWSEYVLDELGEHENQEDGKKKEQGKISLTPTKSEIF